MGDQIPKQSVRKFNRLAIRMQQGDERAARALYLELVGKVYGFCMNRLRRKEVAEDVTQDIFLKLVTKIKFFDPARGNFLTWFWQLSRNTLIDHFRQSSNAEIPEDTASDAFLDRPAPTDLDREFDLRAAHERLMTLMRTLEHEEQELFRLRYVAELSYEDIATILGKSEGSLRVAVMRLKKKFKNHVESSEYEL